MRRPPLQLAITLVVICLVIAASRAQTTTNKSSPVISCSGPNEERIDCGPLCGDRMCWTMREANFASNRCSKQCAPGCFCKNGYLRNSRGICVTPLSCLA
uniref:Putative trypsin inhibitor like cysteine rich domain protein n=2 Tax=Anopheles triannulatus TaxID=58253 RepID=A0A2M4AXX1_9DIPT